MTYYLIHKPNGMYLVLEHAEASKWREPELLGEFESFRLAKEHAVAILRPRHLSISGQCMLEPSWPKDEIHVEKEISLERIVHNLRDTPFNWNARMAGIELGSISKQEWQAIVRACRLEGSINTRRYYDGEEVQYLFMNGLCRNPEGILRYDPSRARGLLKRSLKREKLAAIDTYMSLAWLGRVFVQLREAINNHLGNGLIVRPSRYCARSIKVLTAQEIGDLFRCHLKLLGKHKTRNLACVKEIIKEIQKINRHKRKVPEPYAIVFRLVADTFGIKLREDVRQAVAE